jgi:hypothetical protein
VAPSHPFVEQPKVGRSLVDDQRLNATPLRAVLSQVTNQTASDRVQAGADVDQQASDQGQATADKDRAHPEHTADEETAYEISRQDREGASVERLGNRFRRQSTASDRDEAATNRAATQAPFAADGIAPPLIGGPNSSALSRGRKL